MDQDISKKAEDSGQKAENGEQKSADEFIKQDAAVAPQETKQEEPMARKKTGKKKAPPEPQVYIGPNLPGGTLAAFTVFKNGLPARVEKMKQETPELAHLFVRPADLSAARRRLAGHGKEARAFRAVVKKFF